MIDGLPLATVSLAGDDVQCSKSHYRYAAVKYSFLSIPLVPVGISLALRLCNTCMSTEEAQSH